MLKGLEFIDPIHKAILNRKPIELRYQSFRARQPSQFIYSPYLLKEYRNRWFIIVGNRKGELLTLALDRIVEIKEADHEKYVEPIINMDTYFDNIIGVTKNADQKPVLVVLEIDRANAPYVITKPLHSSQKIIERRSQSLLFSIEVIWNFELEREILGFGEAIKVLSPKKLKGRISYRAKKILDNYMQEVQETDAE